MLISSSSWVHKFSIIVSLGGGFIFYFFPPQLIQKIQFDEHIFQMGWNQPPPSSPWFHQCFTTSMVKFPGPPTPPPPPRCPGYCGRFGRGDFTRMAGCTWWICEALGGDDWDFPQADDWDLQNFSWVGELICKKSQMDWYIYIYVYIYIICTECSEFQGWKMVEVSKTLR